MLKTNINERKNKMETIKIGIDFLHPHQATEKSLGLDKDHIIVDRKDWERVIDYFRRRPEKIKHLSRCYQ